MTLPIELKDHDLIKMVLCGSSKAGMGTDDFVEQTLTDALIAQGINNIVAYESELAAWETIRNFQTELPKHLMDRNEKEFYKILRYVRVLWLDGDERFKQFTVTDMGMILSDKWMHISRSGESVSGEQTLAECWDMMGYDCDDFLYTPDGIFQGAKSDMVLDNIKEALTRHVCVDGCGEIIFSDEWIYG